MLATYPALAQLGLTRTGPWERPTVLDRFLDSPVRAAAHYLYGWITGVRGWAVQRHLLDVREAREVQRLLDKQPGQDVRVVCLSDTHDLVVDDVPDGDVLVHAGDLTNAGTPADVQAQLDWLASLPHAHKVVVCGNHDSWFDPKARAAAGLAGTAAPVFAPNVHYLEHEATTISLANGRSLKVYGAPDIPECGPDSFSFQYPRDSPPWKDTIPSDVDILVTHGPPRHHLDLRLGCAGLLAEVWRVRPALHIFGHVHCGAGRQDVFWDGVQASYEALAEPLVQRSIPEGEWRVSPAEGGLFSDLASLVSLAAAAAVATLMIPVWLVSPGWLAPEAKGHTIMINAGQMDGNTGKLAPGRVHVITL